MQQNPTILCVDDDSDTCELMTFVFENAGFEVITCGIPKEAIHYTRTNDYAAIITDFYLDGMDGTDFCRVVRTFNKQTPIIFLSGETRADKKQAAIESGAQAYFTKPVDFQKLRQTVCELISQPIKTNI